MARVTNFLDLEMDDPRLHPTEVDCGVKLFTIGDEPYVRLSTFGSANRKGSGVSQTLQLDLSAVKQLMAALQQVVPELT